MVVLQPINAYIYKDAQKETQKDTQSEGLIHKRYTIGRADTQKDTQSEGQNCIHKLNTTGSLRYTVGS